MNESNENENIEDIIISGKLNRDKYKSIIEIALNEYKEGQINSNDVDGYFLTASKNGYRFQKQRNEYMRITNKKVY